MNVIRWILVLPVSIGCSIIFPFLYQKIIELVISKDSFASTFILDGVSFFLQGVFFIVPAYFIIPKYKSRTLKIFIIFWFFAVVFGEYYLVTTNRQNVGVWNSILRILGALLAYLNLKLEFDNKIQEDNLEKPEVHLTEMEREALILKIKVLAQTNPKYKEHVEKKLLEKKEEMSRNN